MPSFDENEERLRQSIIFLQNLHSCSGGTVSTGALLFQLSASIPSLPGSKASQVFQRHATPSRKGSDLPGNYYLTFLYSAIVDVLGIVKIDSATRI